MLHRGPKALSSVTSDGVEEVVEKVNLISWRGKRCRNVLYVSCASALIVGCIVLYHGAADGDDASDETAPAGIDDREQTYLTQQALVGAPNAIHEAGSVATVTPEPWWLCTGKHHHDRLIHGSVAEVRASPFPINTEWTYYSRVAEAGLRKWFHVNVPQMRDIASLDLKVRRIERWPAASHRGSSGLIDIEYTVDGSEIVRTMELTDDEARPATVVPAGFPARSATVWFVLAIYNRGPALRKWLAQMSQLARKEESFKLCIAGYSDDPAGAVADAVLASGFPMNRANIVLASPPFKKAAALQSCITALHDDDIAFVSDVDIAFPRDILQRVRRYVVKGVRAFNPIVFYACPMGSRAEDCVERGWTDGGPGIIAAYAADIHGFGGYDTITYGELHGFEDMDFWFRVRYAGLEVVRKREHGIQHLPHPAAPWRIAREKLFGKTWQSYWDALAKLCALP